MKYSDDKRAAFWLAEMLRLGILSEGYLYPSDPSDKDDRKYC
jgi:transposase